MWALRLQRVGAAVLAEIQRPRDSPLRRRRFDRYMVDVSLKCWHPEHTGLKLNR